MGKIQRGIKMNKNNEKKLKVENENKEELKIKKDQLTDKLARLNGGFSPILQKVVSSVDKDIVFLSKEIEMKEIELAKNRPITPYFEFETDQRWLNLRNEFNLENVKNRKILLDNVKKQKESVKQEIPLLLKRINELETILNLEKTKLENEAKPDYIR